MRQAMPPMTEQAVDLKQRLQHAHHSHQKRRLQRRYLLASRQARERREVGHLLGVHRQTIGRWLVIYAAGGLAALLATYGPAGKPVSLAPVVLASLEQTLRRPEGFASYAALRQWVRQTHGVEVQYTTLSTIVRTQCKTTLKTPRPSHTKNPLRPFPHAKWPVDSASSRSSRLRIPVPCGSSAKTNAAADS